MIKHFKVGENKNNVVLYYDTILKETNEVKGLNGKNISWLMF